MITWPDISFNPVSLHSVCCALYFYEPEFYDWLSGRWAE